MVNGIINVYKEKGFTSFDVVAKMRGMFHQKKIGHTGTLDPDAEGVLPVCLGRATKVCDLLTEKDKVYEAVLMLGIKTDTQDMTGQVLETSEVNLSPENVRRTILSFTGDYDQVPPMYSALKVKGQKLCDLARQGITVERTARRVHIFDITISEIRLPEVRMTVHCSKGTYIRTLCEDIGERLGCGGCMKSLLRTRVSAFELKNAWKLSDLQKWLDSHEEGKEMPFLQSVDSIFQALPALTVVEDCRKLLENGNKIPLEFVRGGLLPGNMEAGAQYRLYNWKQGFTGIYKLGRGENGWELAPVKIFDMEMFDR